MPKKQEPLLLLDNSTMYVVGSGEYRSSYLTFEEAKAIIEMYDETDIVRCFTDTAIEQVIHDYIGIAKKNFAYRAVRRMRPGQDAIAFKLYVTPSETQPVVQVEPGVEAKKIQNIYVYCQYISRTE